MEKQKPKPLPSDKPESEIFKCPSCGLPWDTKKANACECGALLVTKDDIPESEAGLNIKGRARKVLLKHVGFQDTPDGYLIQPVNELGIEDGIIEAMIEFAHPPHTEKPPNEASVNEAAKAHADKVVEDDHSEFGVTVLEEERLQAAFLAGYAFKGENNKTK